MSAMGVAHHGVKRVGEKDKGGAGRCSLGPRRGLLPLRLGQVPLLRLVWCLLPAAAFITEVFTTEAGFHSSILMFGCVSAQTCEVQRVEAGPSPAAIQRGLGGRSPCLACSTHLCL